MPILDIIQYPDSRLRHTCSAVEEITDDLRALIDSMTETMYNAPGIGLAASQVARSERIIVVDVGDDPETASLGKLHQIINPEILESRGQTESEEGCLSIPDVREVVKRAAEVTVVGRNPEGSEIRIEAVGLLAICLQHEIDHLNGILFIDRISRLKRHLLRKQLANLAKESV